MDSLMVVKDLTVSGILGARSITRMGGMAEWDRTVRGQLTLTSRLASFGSMLSICSLSMSVDSRIMLESNSRRFVLSGDNNNNNENGVPMQQCGIYASV